MHSTVGGKLTKAASGDEAGKCSLGDKSVANAHNNNLVDSEAPPPPITGCDVGSPGVRRGPGDCSSGIRFSLERKSLSTREPVPANVKDVPPHRPPWPLPDPFLATVKRSMRVAL